MALYRLGWIVDGEDVGRVVWDAWSLTCPEKFDEAVQEEKWQNFSKPYEGEPLTIATIYHFANEHGWSGEAYEVVKPAKQEEAAPATEPEATFRRLAQLSRIEYDRGRIDEAKTLGIRVGTLDDAVKKLRPAEDIEEAGQGRALELYEPEPWPSPVDGVDLLNEIVEEIQTYVILPDAETRAATLWIVSSHGFTAWRMFPRLRIKAPERDCGKSTARDTIAPMTARELSIDGATASWIFRSVEMHRPTLLIDEADSFVQDNEELRGLLNSGHKKDGTVGRVVGEDLEPRNFSTFCPMVLVSIGALPATVESRSIPIAMKRKKPGEKVTRLQDKDIERLKTTVARKIARFVKDHFDELAASDPGLGIKPLAFGVSGVAHN